MPDQAVNARARAAAPSSSTLVSDSTTYARLIDVLRDLGFDGSYFLVPMDQSDARNPVLVLNHPATTETMPSPLSVVQLNYLRWAAEGKSSGDIALITGATRRTVDYHFAEILRKLGVASRTQAVAWLAKASPAPSASSLRETVQLAL